MKTGTMLYNNDIYISACLLIGLTEQYVLSQMLAASFPAVKKLSGFRGQIR
jgi:hypothetical protein